MDTGQINKCLSKVPGFCGTFACNQLPRIPLNNTAKMSLVVNTARLSRRDLEENTRTNVVQGEHWIAIVLNGDGTSLYFDSFGNPPNRKEILEFLSVVSRNGCQHNTVMVQNPLSSTCGVFCIDFIVSVMCEESLGDFLSNFHTNYLVNDRTTVDRVTCFMDILGVKPPLDMRELLY